MKNNLLMQKFLINVDELNSRFKIFPLLYGSLGLQQHLGTFLNPDDIDILIPRIFLKEKWEEFKDYLVAKKYTLVDLHEHTFIKDNVSFSYADIEGLDKFADIKLEDINFSGDKSYLVLSLEQYLKVYKKSCLDGYRINKKEKKDYDKIKLIEQALKKS